MRFLLVMILLLIAGNTFSQAGKYAGSKKMMINKKYTDPRNIVGLKGWLYLGGSVINSLDDPEMITADVFKRVTTSVIIFSIKENAQDTASKEFFIADVIEVKNVLTGQEIKTGLCRNKGIESPEIVALIKTRGTEYVKAIKAWRFNRDKRRAEIVPAVKIDCLNEGFDLTTN